MEEPKPRHSSDVAFNRRNFYIDGVSRPTLQPSSRPEPIRHIEPNVADRPVQGATNNYTSPNRTPLLVRGNQRQSLLNASLPRHGKARHNKPFKKRNSSTKRLLKYSALVLILAIVGLGAWFGSSVFGSLNKVFHGNVVSDMHALFSGSTLNESNGRINILLAGEK